MIHLSCGRLEVPCRRRAVRTCYIPIVFIVAIAARPLVAVTPTVEEFERCRVWNRMVFGAEPTPPDSESVSANQGFSFTYDDEPAARLLTGWRRDFHEKTVDAHRMQRELIYKDTKTGLEVAVEATVFNDFPAVEWVVHFKNTGTADTPILSSIQALDMVLPLPQATGSQANGPQAKPIVRWAKGGASRDDDFEPQEMVFSKPGTALKLDPGGLGRSSSKTLPFFNVEGAGGGVVVAVGWTGEWLAEFTGRSDGRIRMKAGMEHTHLLLHPGETIRTPRMMMLFYQGDRWRGQNLLRQFILAHHRPMPGGKPLVGPICVAAWGGTSAKVHRDSIEQIIRQQLPVEYYWIDAEWYGFGNQYYNWSTNVGNWVVKKDLYPEGMKPLSDALRKSGRELLLWVEPERVVKGSIWDKEHPEWLLQAPAAVSRSGTERLFDLGNPKAREFLTDFISSMITKEGVGCYRQDSNINPLPFWRAADTADRQGMTEIRHVEGLYAFWDELLARHPGVVIDNCSSGGRRIDLETLGRTTPFWRHDGSRDPIVSQCNTQGLLAWVPLNGTGQSEEQNDYAFRSSMSSILCLLWWTSFDVHTELVPPSFSFDWVKRTLDQYVDIRKFYYGDYYPLTSYSPARDVWLVYQLDRPELGQGLIVALRRPESPYDEGYFPLRGLDESANYKITNLDTRKSETLAGSELLHHGLFVEFQNKPDSKLYLYERIK